MKDLGSLLKGSFEKMQAEMGKRTETVKDRTGGCTGKYGGRMVHGKVKSCLADFLELSKKVSKYVDKEDCWICKRRSARSFTRS